MRALRLARGEDELLVVRRRGAWEELAEEVELPEGTAGDRLERALERRKRQREDPGFEIHEHPRLEPVLRDTLGTIVYQEQVIEVAMALSGFSSAEAEGLRRAMSRKRSAEALEANHRRFVAGAVAREVPAQTAERVWQQIQGFSGFGFPKAHSAAFGLLAYQSAWLRIHHPPEFLCALLNEQPMGFYPPDALIHEAQRRGVRLAGPDANRSRVLCHVETPRRRDENRRIATEIAPSAGEVRGGPAVRIGLGYVKGVREGEMESLVAARERDGAYRGIADLASRSGAGRDGLAWAGALDELAEDVPRGDRQYGWSTLGTSSTGGRRGALWEAGTVGTGVRHGDGTQMALPLETPGAPGLEPLSAWDEAIADYRSIGMTLGEHPMAMLRDGLDRELLRSADLERVEHGAQVEVAGMVVARQRPETAKGIVFMLLEDERGTVNPPVYDRHRAEVRTSSLVRARGRRERREGTTNVVVDEVRELERTGPAPSLRAGSSAARRAEAHEKARRIARACEARRRAVAQLRTVAPAGHSFGRRGR